MRTVLAALVLLLPAYVAADDASSAAVKDRWSADMQKFDQLDREHPADEGGVVFVGSSSIRLWDLKESFPGINALNRGFGGSQLSDSVRHLERLVLRHRPRVVVLYAGDNDISGGKSPSTVVRDFEAFVAGIRKTLPETKIAYIAIKPSLARWKLAEPMQAANAGIAAVCEKSENCVYVDIWTPMLGEDGTPRPELFVKDGLHLSKQGYAVWTKQVAPLLEPAVEAGGQ